MIMNKWKRFLAAGLVASTLFTQGQVPVSAAETGVVLYKNNTLVGEYTTVNTAFGNITDASADYKVVLKNDQTLTGYASWPKANSIKIQPYDLQTGVTEGETIDFIVAADSITANSNVILSDWICFRPEYQSGKVSYANFNIQGYTMTFDQEVSGHTVAVGCQEDAGNTGINISGSTGSKVVLNETARLYNSSIQVDTLQMNVESSSATSELLAHEIALYDSAKSNTVKNVIASYGNGITLSDADMQITTFTEVTNPVNASAPVTQYIWLEGDSSAVIGNMYDNCKLQIDYRDMNTVKNSTVSITGSVVPQAVMINVALNHKISNADASRAFSFENAGEYLLYAPNLASGSVTASCTIYNDLNGEYAGQYSYYGQIEGEGGYYDTEAIPSMQFSDAFFMTESRITEKLDYTNTNGDLQAVSWNIHEMGTNGYVDHPEWTKTFGWDKTSLGFGITGLNSSSTYFLNGYFTYGTGTVSVVIPIFTSPAVTSAYFDATSKTLVNPSFTSSQWIKLNYTASSTPEVIWTTSNPAVISIVGTGVNATQKINGYGSAIVRAYIGNYVLTCNVTVSNYDVNKSGWHQADDGNWYYYKNGKVDTSKNGIVPKGGEYWYAVAGKADFTVTTVAKYGTSWLYVYKGKVDFSYTGLAKNYNGWWYINAGKVDLTYDGVSTNAAGTWYIEDGRIDTSKTGIYARGGAYYSFKNGKVDESVNGIVKFAGGYWYFVKGKIDKEFKGLVKNAGSWWYVQNGKIDFTYDGVGTNANGTWYVEDGKVDGTKTGIYGRGGAYYSFKNGKVDETVNGIVKNAGSYWYFVNGKIDFAFKGVVKNGGSWWYVQKGKIDFTYDGVGTNDNGTWYIEDGKVDGTKNGILVRGGVYYYFKGGKVQEDFTGLVKNYAGWWYIKDGKIDFIFVGIVENENGFWYIAKGKIDTSFSGTVEYEGKTYEVVKGKATLVE